MAKERKSKVSRQRKWRIKQFELGNCLTCGKRAVTRRHCEKHRKKHREANREWYQRNKRHISEYNKRYYKERTKIKRLAECLCQTRVGIMARMNFNSIFRKEGDEYYLDNPVRVGGITADSGIKFHKDSTFQIGGINFPDWINKDLEVEIKDKLIIIKGIYG